MRKKLVYVQHFQAWDEAQRNAQEGEDPMDGIDPSQIAENAGDMGNIQQDLGPMAGDHGQSSQQKPHASKDIHPQLKQYENLINVQNPGEDMGWERRDEIMHESGQPTEPDVDIDPSKRREKGTVDVDRGSVDQNTGHDSDSIDQAGDG